MRTILRTLLCALVVTIAVAPTAFAQSAGDDQYVDPFQQQPGGDHQGPDGGNGDSSGGDQGSSTDAPADTTTDTSAGDTLAAGETDTTSGGDGSALPHTGLPLAGLVLTGALLVAGGAALRRRATLGRRA